ncbi:MAG: hypothetical protein BWY06_02131 [Candidatus Latescibacteria bacterium ADurb.Bin168]|nr:MAG: hypothetical protein BWY06_02131 [Candidatus Latescibacteria bacterium ADurb.Bin168]
MSSSANSGRVVGLGVTGMRDTFGIRGDGMVATCGFRASCHA